VGGGQGDLKIGLTVALMLKLRATHTWKGKTKQTSSKWM